jgi:hypothetical protein
LKPFIFGLFQLDLHVNNHANQLKLLIQAGTLSLVTIFEIVCCEVEAWPTGHDVGDNLHKLLLLQGVSDVFIAFHIHLHEFYFFELEFSFTGKEIIQNFKPVLNWVGSVS